jgi:hypothetical protein
LKTNHLAVLVRGKRLSIAIKCARKNLLFASGRDPQPIQQINEKDLEIYFIARIHNLFREKGRMEERDRMRGEIDRNREREKRERQKEII